MYDEASGISSGLGKDSDEPAYSPSLIRVSAMRLIYISLFFIQIDYANVAALGVVEH